RRSGQDDDARIRDRRAGDALCVEPDLVGRAQRAGDDERVVGLLFRIGWRARLRDAPVGARDPRTWVWCMNDPHARGCRRFAAPKGGAMRALGRPGGAHPSRTLPVLLPSAERLIQGALRERETGPTLRLERSHGVALIIAFVCG